jgi:hypothetical protein
VRRRESATPRADYDTPWKEFLTVFFRWFLKLVLPELYERIDWRRRPVFLDNELRRLSPRSETGRLYTDKLVKVWEKGAPPNPFLVHLEAQNQYRGNLPEHTYTYNARIWIETRLDVVSIVILGDNNPNWRPPNRYQREMPGTRLDFEYHLVKLLDLDEEWLLQEARQRNPAALMLLAFRRAHETENDMHARLEARWQLIRLMIDRRYNPEYQAHILRLLEWVMILPEVLEKRLDELIEEYKRERGTTFVSRFEKRAIREGLMQGIEQGIQQGIQQGVQQGVAAMRDAVMRVLRRRFGEAADQVRPAIDAIDSLEVLESLVDVALDAPTLQAFVEALLRDTSSAS